MLRRLVLSILLVLVFAFPVYGADYYVSQAGAGDKSGDAVGNAIDGLKNVVFGEDAGEVGSGDTLWVLDANYAIHTSAGLIEGQSDLTPVSGADEDNRLVIRGDYPDRQGVIFGGFIPDYRVEGWVQQEAPNTSVYKYDLAYSSYNQRSLVIEDPDTFDGTVDEPMTSVESIAACQATPGSFYWYDPTGDNDIYVHCTDSGDPTNRILIPNYGYEFKLDTLAYITFQNIYFYQVPRTAFLDIFNPDVEQDDVGNHLRWDTCRLMWGGYLIRIGDDSDYNEVLNCEIAWGDNGIYTISNTNNAPSYYKFNYNYIHDIGVKTYHQNSDAHAIGTQGGHDGEMLGNYCVNCGTGPSAYSFSSQIVKDITIAYNFVQDCHQLGGATGYGIFTMGDNQTLSDKTGIKVYGNVVTGTPTAYRFQFEDELEFFNNISYDCGVGLSSGRSNAAIAFDNANYNFQIGDVVTNGLGQTATVGDVDQVVDAPTGILAFKASGDSFSDGDNLIVGGSIRATADGSTYTFGANIKSRNNYFLNNTKHISFTGGTVSTLNTDYNRYYPDDGDRFTYLGTEYNFAEFAAVGTIDEDNSAIEELSLTNPAGGDFTPSAALPVGEDQGSYHLVTDSSGPTWPTGTGGGTFSLDDPDSFGWFIGAIGQGSSITRTLLSVTVTGGKIK